MSSSSSSIAKKTTPGSCDDHLLEVQEANGSLFEKMKAIKMSSSSSTSKKITLRSCDDFLFEVEEADMSLCQTIKNMIEDGCASDIIPLPNVEGFVLARIIMFNKMNKNNAASSTSTSISSAERNNKEEEELKKWNASFIDFIVEEENIFDVIEAAEYLNNEKLLDLTCQHVADSMSGKTPEEIREIFGIINDFTPEEEAELRKEDAWAFE